MTTAPVQTGQIRDGYRWLKQDCPLCNRPPDKFLGRRGGAAHREGLGVATNIWQCTSCRLIFPNPMPLPIGGVKQHYGVEANKYFEHHDLNAKAANAIWVLDHIVKIRNNQKGKLLDIGAGRGELLLQAANEGWEAIGIEPSPTFADYAVKYSGAEIKRAPLEECGFPDNEFDAVVMAGVLEHLYNPIETVREISRILKKGGVFYFDVPNEVGLYPRLGNAYLKLRGRDWVINLSPTFPPFHVFGFGPKSAERLIKQNGLKAKLWRYYSGVSLVPANGGFAGKLESQAAKAITTISKFGKLGAYIEAWAVKE